MHVLLWKVRLKMNDSLDAFRSPDVVGKPRCLSIRRNETGTSKNQSNGCNKENEQNKKEAHNPVNQVPNCDDTMFDVTDLEFDASNKCIAENDVNNFELLEKMSCNLLHSSPQSGFCSICKNIISKDDCSTHYTACLSDKFSLSSKPSVKLADLITCSTCGKDVEVTDYPSHSEVCKQSNVEVAKKLTDEIVTSSYFDRFGGGSSYLCPSCNKDLTMLSTPLKTRHVNM